MLRYAILLLIVAVFAAYFGFVAAAGVLTGLAKILFFLFLIGAVVALVRHFTGRTTGV